MRVTAGSCLSVSPACLPSPPAEDAASLFQVISRRDQKGSVTLTTNPNVAAWRDIFSDTTNAAAMLDRLLHRSVVFTIAGDNYRLRAYQAQARKHRPNGAAGQTHQHTPGWGCSYGCQIAGGASS